MYPNQLNIATVSCSESTPGHLHLAETTRRFRVPMPQILVTCILSAATIGIYSIPALSAQLQWQRDLSPLPAAFHTITCHFTHWSGNQLFWDLLAFLALGSVCELCNRRQFLATLLLSAVAIPLTVAWFHPQLPTYRGLSGIDSALFVLLTCFLACSGYQRRDWLLASLGVFGWLVFVGKTGFELATSQTLFVESTGDFIALPIAHLVGAACGTVVWAVPAIRDLSPRLSTQDF